MLISRNIELINSLDTLKILRFWQIIKEKNVLLLDLDHKEGKKYTKDQLEEIESTWLKLYDEYFCSVR